MSEYQEITFSKENLDKVITTFPANRVADWIKLAHKEGKAEIIWDSVRYNINVGERKLFPREVARIAIGQGAVVDDFRTGEPTFLFVAGGKSDGTVSAPAPFTCTAPGCTVGAFSSASELMAHLETHNTGRATAVSNKVNLEPEAEEANAATLGADE